jgi:hypothetical protein
MCGRSEDGLPPCWQTWPNRPENWCRHCRTRFVEADDAGRPLNYEGPVPADDWPAWTDAEVWDLGPEPPAADLEDGAAQAAWDDQFAPPPPPEDLAAAFDEWTTYGDRPAWSLEQVCRPSPN